MLKVNAARSSGRSSDLRNSSVGSSPVHLLIYAIIQSAHQLGPVQGVALSTSSQVCLCVYFSVSMSLHKCCFLPSHCTLGRHTRPSSFNQTPALRPASSTSSDSSIQALHSTFCSQTQPTSSPTQKKKNSPPAASSLPFHSWLFGKHPAHSSALSKTLESVLHWLC